MMELCHFGEDCAPGIIINDILKRKKKHLFMLGVYKFNDMLFYLRDSNYEKIYDKEHLIITEKNNVRHTTYNFVFNHDYTVSDSKIVNYNIIVNRFNLKIKNFRELLLSENMCIFITFTKNIDDLKIDEMLDWLSLNKKTFHLMIFTSNTHTQVSHSQLYSIINLKNNYARWYLMKSEPKMILYKEIYEKFIDCLNKCKIEHNFPLELTM